MAEWTVLQAERAERLARHQARSNLGDRLAHAFRDERHGAARARIDLEHIELIALDRELHVHQALDAERERKRPRFRADALDDGLAERIGRQRAGRIARVDAGLLDVLHDARDEHLAAIAERIDIDLDRVLQE